jgi:hypothetical protein
VLREVRNVGLRNAWRADGFDELQSRVWRGLSAVVLIASGSSGAKSALSGLQRTKSRAVQVAERRRVVRVSRTGVLHGACPDGKMTHNWLWKAVVLGD